MNIIEVSEKLGKERIEFSKSCKSQDDWEKWESPKNDYAFEYGSCWKSTIEYRVENFEAEVGFFIDVLGTDCVTISENYAMLRGWEQEFAFSVRRPKDDETTTPKDAFVIEFMVKDMMKTAENLLSRGIHFIEEPRREAEGSPMKIASFQTPHGMKIKLWSFEPQ